MGRSFGVGILCTTLMVAAPVLPAQARGSMAAPAFRPVSAPHGIIAPRIGMRGAVARGVPNPRPGFGRRGRFARGVFGVDAGFALGMGLDALDAAAIQPAYAGEPGLGPELLPPPDVIPAPSPCLPPVVYKVGRGLTRPPKVRVVYGVPACAGY